MLTDHTLVQPTPANNEDILLSHDVPNGGAWDRFVTSHSQGSPFHLMAWQRLIRDTFRSEPKHIVAHDARTGEICGVLPLFLVRSLLFGRMLVSTPQAPYGGVLASSHAAEQAILHRACEMAQTLRVQFLELRCFRNASDDDRFLQKDLYVTFRQVLQEDLEANLLSIPRKTRAEIREGIKNGLEFKVDAIGPDEFFQVYSRSVRDLGTPVFTRRLFEGGLREFGSNCKICSVHWKGTLVAAVWTLFYKDEVVPYYGGSIREYNHLAVNNFMYWMLMKYGVENGYRVFDFGRSKKGTGSFDFKKRWGMMMTDLPYQYALVRSQSMPDTSPLNPKFSLAIQTWRRLPLSLTRSVGPLISKHFI
jgi:FemAB-related protein (PEP-CTERM system-associated)